MRREVFVVHPCEVLAMTKGYSALQIGLHWAIVVLVAAQFLTADLVEAQFERVLAGETPAPTLHNLLGMLALALMLVRLGVRVRRGTPAPPAAEPGWAKTAAGIAHWAFYGVLIALPISGMASYALGSETAAAVHEALTVALLALIVVHVGAVFVHMGVWQTGLIARMLRPGAD